MKKLPIGIQTFEKIREGNYAYIDKTEVALKLASEGDYYFLSRPRRFGKSLFLDTLKDLFEGKKNLFEGLAIHDQWDWSVTSPVIRVSFGAGVHDNVDALDTTIQQILKGNAKRLGLTCHDTGDVKYQFAQLLEAACEKHGKVVILVDEYDKPILDNISDEETARAMRDRLKNFYSVIKDSDAFIKFVFITGVSKFSKVNLFSGLNNLEDITLNPHYATICGYTHLDLQTTFKAHLQGADMVEVKDWYNGYNYLGEKVYNPFDILLFISNGVDRFNSYWWSTGNPGFLVELLKSKTYFIPELSHYQADSVVLDSFDVDHIDLVALLWQTGYLTIDHEEKTPFGSVYHLALPNREIRLSLNRLFINYLTTQTGEVLSYQKSLYEVLVKGDVDALEGIFTRLFASIPYQTFTNNKLQDYEGYYTSVIYAYLASLGFEIISEDCTNRGRIDITLKIEGKVYLFEVKVTDKATQEASGDKALAQIQSRQYAQKYQGAGEVYCVGLTFSKQTRNLAGVVWEKLDLVAFLQESPLGEVELDMARDKDLPRDI
ncbi:ATP-binding protein [Leucothrix pacifica]|uniref:AAA-ATPase-like domain-containing protein n=1 Tax=Leucothrix pacifica TaxID=1247513 RepID=A0A317CSU5_9GAMM|nr:ATP-binding protein [Leucothrix pacifica]PWQ99510.1 hypothetical protein DKW60_05725 [Leucothrix pacifica]